MTVQETTDITARAKLRQGMANKTQEGLRLPIRCRELTEILSVELTVIGEMDMGPWQLILHLDSWKE